MKVLVTGAAGYVGLAVLERVGREFEVRATDRDPVSIDVEQVTGDLCSFDIATQAVAGVDAVVHLAAGAGPAGYGQPDPGMSNAVIGTVNLMEAATRAGVRRFVLMSSGAVMEGYPPTKRLTADLPGKFTGLYALSKHLQEVIGRQYADEHGLVVPALRPWFVVDSRTWSRKNGRAIENDAELFGLICRFDLADAVVSSLSAEIVGFQPFHLMATEVGKARVDWERTEAVLGWTPSTDFRQLTMEAGADRRATHA